MSPGTEEPTMTSAPDTRRLTVAPAVVTYLPRQYSVADGQRRRLIPATLGIFGHGNEFRYRAVPPRLAVGDASKAPRLEGDYLRLDLVQRWLG
jgi:hypothetical protein